MLEWKVVTGEEALKNEIEQVKQSFDDWFSCCWARTVSREKMLSPDSPVQHVYYKMCLPFEEVKEKLPNELTRTCSDCGELTDIWIETDFSFCDEYGCGILLCPKCAKKLKSKIQDMEIIIGGKNNA